MGCKHNPENRAAYKAAHRAERLEYARNYNQRYYLANREKLLAKNREWYKQKGCTEEFRARYRERKRKYEREYYRKHREKLLERSKEWQRQHYQERREELIAKKRAKREQQKATRRESVPTPTVIKQERVPTPKAPKPQRPTTLIGQLQYDTQQLYDDVVARVAEIEELFNDLE